MGWDKRRVDHLHRPGLVPRADHLAGIRSDLAARGRRGATPPNGAPACMPAESRTRPRSRKEPLPCEHRGPTPLPDPPRPPRLRLERPDRHASRRAVRPAARRGGARASPPAGRPAPAARPGRRRSTPPRWRALAQTAHAYADRVGIDVIERDDLCEWFGGEWEEKDFEEIFAEHPEAIELFRNQNPAWHLAPGSEAGEDFQRRCVTAVEDIIATHPDRRRHRGGARRGDQRLLRAHPEIADQDMFFLPENTSLNTRGDPWRRAPRVVPVGREPPHRSGLVRPPAMPPTAMRWRRGPERRCRLYSRETERRPQGSRSPCPSSSCPPNGPKRSRRTSTRNDAFKQAATGQNATIQQVITR